MLQLKRIEISTRGLYVVQGDSAAPKFKRLEASLGWLNPQGEDHELKHALLVGGEQEDGRYRVFLEFQGNLAEIETAAIDIKDALLVERFWSDTTKEQIVNQLREADGLCHYRDHGRDDRGKTLYHNAEPLQTWPYFRKERPLAAICGVPDVVRVGLSGGFDRLVRLVHIQKLIINQGCQISHWTLAQKNPPEDHPVARALIWLAWALENCGDIEEIEGEEENYNPYPNRPVI
jgi:hypothetical protein